MKDRARVLFAVRMVLCMGLVGCRTGAPPTLEIGSAAPPFSLSGVDGKVHTLGDYAGTPVLVVVFMCNHCPVAQMYEQRIQRLHSEYQSRGVTVLAINPDSPKTLTFEDLAYSDVPDTLQGMTARAAYRKLEYPYLYDGDSQAAAKAFKVVAVPQAFVFDARRTLRYVGRIDDSPRGEAVKSSELRAAIDAVLANEPVSTASTAVEGCPIKWLDSPRKGQADKDDGAAAPVGLNLVEAPQLRALRANGTPNLLMVNFWATWCAPCLIEFPELQNTYRMYRSRHLDFVTVSVDSPNARSAVMKVLQEQRASSRNHLFASDDTASLQDAFDPAMPAAVPFTLLIAPNGDVVHQQVGEADVSSLRRAILANLPDDRAYPGSRAYWSGQ